MALLDLKDITRTFVSGQVKTEVLKGLNLSVEPGEFVSIMGPSGSGKSTFLNIIGCLDMASTGSYSLNGVAVESLSQNALADLRNREIGFVFQSFHLLKDLTARANVELPLIYRGIGAQERRKLSEEALETVGLSHRINHYPKQMSGGEQQRVAIARAIIGKPNLLLADEPTGALDSKTSINIMELFIDLNRRLGITVVQVTHDVEVGAFGGRIINVFDGLIDSEETVSAERREQALQTMKKRSQARSKQLATEDLEPKEQVEAQRVAQEILADK